MIHSDNNNNQNSRISGRNNNEYFGNSNYRNKLKTGDGEQGGLNKQKVQAHVATFIL